METLNDIELTLVLITPQLTMPRIPILYLYLENIMWQKALQR